MADDVTIACQHDMNHRKAYEVPGTDRRAPSHGCTKRRTTFWVKAMSACGCKQRAFHAMPTATYGARGAATAASCRSRIAASLFNAAASAAVRQTRNAYTFRSSSIRVPRARTSEGLAG